LTDASGKRLLASFNQTAKELASKRNWHGHDGAEPSTAEEVDQALRDGAVTGKWFIPTRELLIGTDDDRHRVSLDDLYTHRNTGAFAGTFVTAVINYDVFSGWYWSCSRHPDTNKSVGVARFTWDDFDWSYRWDDNADRPSGCRPVRVELAV
jgi:hypothetical protein